MSLYTSLISSLVFPLHERIKNHSSVAVRKEMELSQWWDTKHLEALQLFKLQRLLTHIQAHVPYYRDLFTSIGFKATDVHSLADLARLPLLDKPRIRANTEALKSENGRDLARFNTGGSSGEPLIFYIGKERVSHDVAAKWRATRWWDVDIGDPEVVIWGSPIELGAQDGLRALRDKLLRTRLLPAFEMSAQKLDGSWMKSAPFALKCFSAIPLHYPISPAMPKPRVPDGRSRHSGRIRYFRTTLRRAAPADQQNIRMPSGKWLRRPGCGFHRP